MVIYLAERDDVITIDFNCCAPAAARPDMFNIVEETSERIVVADRAHEHGGRAVEESGMISGLTLA